VGHEGEIVGQEDLRQVQGGAAQRVVRIICSNQKHKQRQG
jgi:hypothetical protein